MNKRNRQGDDGDDDNNDGDQDEDPNDHKHDFNAATCRVQVCRSISDWSHGFLTEHSIQNACTH